MEALIILIVAAALAATGNYLSRVAADWHRQRVEASSAHQQGEPPAGDH